MCELLETVFLVVGESFRSLGFAYGIAAQSVSIILPEVLDAIYDSLQPTYLKVHIMSIRNLLNVPEHIKGFLTLNLNCSTT